MSDYETLRQRHVADALALAPLLVEQLDWPADRLAAHRTRQLRERPQVTVEIADRLERPGGPAKLKRFIPLDQPSAPLSAGR